MAKTQIADIVEPAIYAQYFIERTAESSVLIQSGIAAPVATVQQQLNSGGRVINLPFWQDLSGADEVLSDSSSLTPGKISATKDIAHKLARGKAWSVNDLAEAVSGDDPLGAIVDLNVEYWDRRRQDMLTQMLAGLFKGDLSATHVNDISTEDYVGAGTDANLFSDNALLDTEVLLGDAADNLTGVIAHSVVVNRMKKLGVVEDVSPENAPGTIRTYRGKTLITSDSVFTEAGATSGTKYHTYLFGPGAIALNTEDMDPEKMIETDRDILAQDDIMATVWKGVLHPRGVAWQGASMAGQYPTNAELATTTNWSKVFEDKNIRLAALISNG